MVETINCWNDDTDYDYASIVLQLQHYLKLQTIPVGMKRFRTLADAEVNVDMIVQNVSAEGHTDISFTLPHEQTVPAQAVVEAASASLGAAGFVTDDEIARVSLIGAGMQTNPGVAATMFETLSAHGINIEMISTSAIRVSCVVAADRAEDAVQLVHTAFGLDG